MRFQLVSLSGMKFDEEVYEVILPTLDGKIGVLDHHMPLVSVASRGMIAVRHKSSDPDDFRDYFAVSGGVIEVADNTLTVLVDEADHADEVDAAEAQKAYDRAQNMIKEAKDQVSLEHAQTLVDRQAVRIQVAGLKRRRRS
ncbi:ATP synthase F1 subunit epsilon [Candidatus Saccharibacteria bacterium]|nr:ATP synthase F1 subunit epsilon [Candidatus Saccharibacteria bacterium]